MAGTVSGSTFEADTANTAATAAPVTMGHTWVIVVIALVLLWVLGGIAFRSVRM